MKKNNQLRLTVKQGFVALVSLTLSLGFSARCLAQAPSLDAYYDRLDPKTTFKFKWKGEEKVCNVGAFRWQVPMSSYATGGLDRNFTGYCAEIDVSIVVGKLYKFKIVTLDDPKFYGLQANAEGIRAAQRRVTLIRELFGRYYSESKTAHPDDTFAFQIALWELTHETEPVERMALFDMFSGDFQANYPRDQAPAFVLKAQDYLNSLVGDDSVYYQNPNISGRELIRLDGLPNAEGLVAQSQYALRYIDGGVPGIGPFANALNATGAGIGGVGGAGGFAAGGAGPLGVPVFGDTGNPGGGPLVNVGATGIGTTPPPTTTNSRPPGGGPQGTPVPAPTGLLLGMIAVGAFATRRIYSRLMQR